MDISLPYGFELRDYQKPLWNACVHEGKRRMVTVWPRRNGKDIVAINILIAKAMQRKGLYFYIAPFYNQVKSIIWQGSDGSGKRFLDYIPKELISKKNESDLKIELINGSILKFIGSDNIDSIVGNNPIGIIFTEFSLHKPEAWHYLRPVLAENNGWALFNGTPRGLNHFYQMYEMSKRDGLWFTQLLTRDDTGIPSMEAIDEDRRSGMPESLIEQEYYTSWTSSSETTLIPLDIIQPAISQVLKESDYSFSPRVMGVDVAYAAKGDKAVIAKRQGRYLHPLQKFQGLDNMSLASRVARDIEEWSPAAVFIDSGRGEGVISRLIQLGYAHIVIPVHFSGKPYSDLYLNKRAEIWCKTRDWFLTDNPPKIPDDEEIITDLGAPTFEVNERGFIQLESKKKMKDRGFASTDCGDAIALTFADDVPMDEMEELKQLNPSIYNLSELGFLSRPTEASNDYDVLNHLNSDAGQSPTPDFS